MQPGTKLFTNSNCFTGRQRQHHLKVATHKAAATAILPSSRHILNGN